MNLVNIVTARSIWLFPIEEINPHGLDIVPILASIQTRYRFQKYPVKSEDIFTPPNGIQFERGAFKMEDGRQIGIMRFTIFNDGLVAETADSTVSTDLFIVNVLAFLKSNHGLNSELKIVRKIKYLSELVVTSDINLDVLHPNLAKFSTLLRDVIPEQAPFLVNSIRFGNDPSTGLALEFKFERRAGIPFSENLYFSHAPFTTEQHLEILNSWESLLSEQR